VYAGVFDSKEVQDDFVYAKFITLLEEMSDTVNNASHARHTKTTIAKCRSLRKKLFNLAKEQALLSKSSAGRKTLQLSEAAGEIDINNVRMSDNEKFVYLIEAGVMDQSRFNDPGKRRPKSQR